MITTALSSWYSSILEGETLDHRLRRGPLPSNQVVQYALQIAEALDKAQREGITHRDLKPGNIMLTKSGLKLLDTNGKDDKEKYFNILRAKSGSKELNDFADGSVGFVIGGFQFALGCVLGIGAMVEETVG